MKKIAFLFGSGISVSSGMPNTRCITERILSGKGIVKHTNGVFYLDDRNSVNDGKVREITCFLKMIRDKIELYFKKNLGRDPNYEDIYFVCWQIRDHFLQEHENPVMEDFIKQLVNQKNKKLCYQTLQELASSATDYIQDVVWGMLKKRPTGFTSYDWIGDVCRDKEIKELNIFTLNHDVVLEKYFLDNSINFVDGFKKLNKNGSLWKPGLFDGATEKVRLYKLHGSIDWFLFREKTSGQLYYIKVPCLNSDLGHLCLKVKKEKLEIDSGFGPRPVLLAGTFNKIFWYTRGVFRELYFRFSRIMQDIDCLVVCGYGFGDKAVNTVIAEWMEECYKRRMIIIHPCQSNLKRDARGAISNNWDQWQSHGRLGVIRKRAEGVTWDSAKCKCSRLKPRPSTRKKVPGGKIIELWKKLGILPTILFK